MRKGTRQEPLCACERAKALSIDARHSTIGNNEQRVLDGEASCASTQHIHIASLDGNKDDEVKCTCYASNIDTQHVKLPG